MRIDKVILKTVLSTLLAIFVLCGVTVTALAFLYPSTMMELSYNVGLDDASAWFAHRAYNQLDNVFYIGYATHVAIGRDDPEAIEKYGDKFIADEGFEEYCAERDKASEVEGSYAQYIYGKLYSSKYKLGKKTEAVEGAFAVNKEAFPKSNAVAAVLFASILNGQGDKPTMELILEKMRALKAEQTQTQTFSEADIEYLNTLITLTAERMEKLS